MPFKSLGLPPPLVKGVRAAGYTDPTPIQTKAIPIVLAGHDLIGAAQTGTGKTAAFILPILTRLMKGPPALRALILVPTRELAAQVETSARDYARFTDLKAGVVFGGVPIGPQERMLGKVGVDLLVATPGRLLDLAGRQSVTFEDIEVLVLDEADRMVDMGFAPDLRRILKLLPTKRQTMMFSATMPPELNKVASEALKNPKRIDLAPPSRPATGITQAMYPVPRHLKTDLLDELIHRSDMSCALVFTRTKHGADRLARQLQRRGHSTAALHGNRSQGQRERALSDLKRGRVQILVATDIASRGIDVNDISHVINYDVPHTPEDYVHRIGRTGRAEAVGDAFTLMAPEERDEVAAIERFLGKTVPRVLLPDFDYKKRGEKVVHGDRPSSGRDEGRPRRSPGGRKSSQGSSAWGRQEGGASRGSGDGASRGANAAHASGATGSGSEASHGRRPQRNQKGRRDRKRM